MLACVFLFLKVRPIRKLSWKRKYNKILHLMDFQRKFNKHVLIWGRLFICCLVFIGRNIALSYMPSNRQCLKDTVLHSVFNSDGVSFKNQNSWSFIIFFYHSRHFYQVLFFFNLFFIYHLPSFLISDMYKIPFAPLLIHTERHFGILWEKVEEKIWSYGKVSLKV